jgi:putative nucleotidyltransferase with HDIG domain
MKTLPLIKHLFTKEKNKSSFHSNFSITESKFHHNQQDEQTLVIRWICKIHSPMMILISVTSLTGLVSYRFYNQPELAVGTISPSRIVAPSDGTFVDQKTTEQKIKEIRNGFLKVYKENVQVSQDLKIRLHTQLQQTETLRNLKQQLPQVSPKIIATTVQEDLCTLPEPEWQEIISTVKLANQQGKTTVTSENQKLNQLLNYQQKVSSPQFELFLRQLENNRQQYKFFQQQLNQQLINELNETEITILLTLETKTWEEFKNQILSSQNLILTQGIYEQFSSQQKYSTATLHLKDIFSEPVTHIGVKLLVANLDNNLVVDKEKSLEKQKIEEQNIEPVIVSRKKGELIVDAGEEISREAFVLLDNYDLSRRGINFAGVAASAGLVSVSIVFFMTMADKMKKKLRRRDQVLLWLLSTSVPIINLFDTSYNSLPIVGFLSSTFYGPTLAVTQVVTMTGLSLFQTNMNDWQYLLPAITAGLVAALLAGRLHSREELAFLGSGIGLTQGSLCFLVALLSTSTASLAWYAILPNAIWYGTVGLTYTVLALGISPYLERLFDLITPIRLAELSNPNRPLLKRLATETPGTFQHTMFVATLAEVAARRLHCNVELVRAGTLYHDIGKMHDPLAFIENQMGGANKHDQINDPWKSAEIIKKHVSEGIAIAKKCGLPQAICDFIPQHQGTLLISYFYFQAKKEAENDPQLVINESDFRYDGPIPQCRETAIVMLADGCEAALRSLKGTTPDQAIAMVHKIFKARWRDHQLDDSGIKYEELPIIAEVFVDVWQQFNHQRITYPQGALEIRTQNSELRTQKNL